VDVVSGTFDIDARALLIRPDGYVAWAAPGEPLTAALTQWFGPQSVS
jgi:bifunctional hydroxylase/dehydrase